MVRICIIQGHPTRGRGHFCHAMADAYAQGAVAAGHAVRTLAVAEMEFPVLRSKQDWDKSPPSARDRERPTGHQLGRASRYHPSALDRRNARTPQGFFEQALRPGFAMALIQNGGWSKLLAGRSARVVVTMGMPAVVYRWYFGAHGLKSLTQNLALVGIKPRRSILVGMIEAMSDRKRRAWLHRLNALGRAAA
jgi:putative NADPH-quinone reductase